ncbi:uronyl 2-sulfotransferase-like isoform X4 [Asterias rubens]|uniref:uronyl 2-sulfotransferase-like isoform X4 n=1 Tax=Asterias rubens TaxID=7604 RepID=UPI0014554AB4|nr:uronyl 2-sulfotransferase-like isoform X4 [Asterias rubens]
MVIVLLRLYQLSPRYRLLNFFTGQTIRLRMAFSFSRRLIIMVLLLLIGYFLVLIITEPSRSPLEVSSASGLYSSKSWPAFVGVNATSSQNSMVLYPGSMSFQKQTTSLHWKTKTNNVDDKIHFINNQKGNCFFSAHFGYINYEWPSPPMVISLVRDPVERLMSSYYYSMYGDNEKSAATLSYVKSMRSKMAQAMGGNTTVPTLSECILQDLPFCTDHKRLFTTLKYFCGNDLRCSNLSEWTYNQTVKNIDASLAVGLTEEFEDYLRVLEQLVPSLFEGLVTIYKKPSSVEAGKTYATKTKHHKEPLTPQAQEKLLHVLQMEYRIYNYIKNRFHQLKKELGVI